MKRTYRIKAMDLSEAFDKAIKRFKKICPKYRVKENEFNLCAWIRKEPKKYIYKEDVFGEYDIEIS